MSRHQAVLLLTAALLTPACLYTGEIERPPGSDENAPEFVNCLPSNESVVTIDQKGLQFEVVYTDKDPQDVPLLEVDWTLDDFSQGNGTKTFIWPQDLGQDGTGRLIATVTDPSGKSDYQVWQLRTATSAAQGE